MLFKRNKINELEETVAEDLQAARKEKNITLDAASKKIGVNPDYLTALENCDYSSLPSGLYANKFLHQYCTFLGLNYERVAKKYQREKGTAALEKNGVFSKKKIRKIELVIFPKILRNILLIIVITAFFSYLGYYLLKTFSLPVVEIYQPPDNLVTTDSFVNVIGRTDTKTQIDINNIQVLKDNSGNFQERVDLKKGINNIVISAQNKYSRKKIIQKQVLVK